MESSEKWGLLEHFSLNVLVCLKLPNKINGNVFYHSQILAMETAGLILGICECLIGKLALQLTQ